MTTEEDSTVNNKSLNFTLDFFVESNGITESNGFALSNEDYVNLYARNKEAQKKKNAERWQKQCLRPGFIEKRRMEGRAYYWLNLEKERKRSREKGHTRYWENPERFREERRKQRRDDPIKCRMMDAKHRKKRRDDPEKYRIDIENTKKSYQKHIDKRREEVRIRKLRNKKQVIHHYSSGKNECACCGMKGVVNLTIDHIKPGGRKHVQRIKADFYTSLKRAIFPPGYQVLCWACNLSKGQKEHCTIDHSNS